MRAARTCRDKPPAGCVEPFDASAGTATSAPVCDAPAAAVVFRAGFFTCARGATCCGSTGVTACSTAWRAEGVAATTDVAATVATVAATFAPPNENIVWRRAMNEPASLPARSLLTTRFVTDGSSVSPAASDRRARNRRVSTAACERSSSVAISLYERPCHSRRSNARRCCAGSPSSAFGNSIRSCGSASRDGRMSCIASRSPGDSTRRRRDDER